MNKSKNKPKSYYTAKELFNRKIMEVPMFWKPFIPLKGVVGITGSSDAGKSTLLRQLAIETCLRRNSFLGFPLNSRYGSLVYISTEDTDDAIYRMRFVNTYFGFALRHLMPFRVRLKIDKAGCTPSRGFGSTDHKQ